MAIVIHCINVMPYEREDSEKILTYYFNCTAYLYAFGMRYGYSPSGGKSRQHIRRRNLTPYYFVSDELDLDDAILYVIYENGYEEQVPITKDMIAPSFNTDRPGKRRLSSPIKAFPPHSKWKY